MAGNRDDERLSKGWNKPGAAPKVNDGSDEDRGDRGSTGEAEYSSAKDVRGEVSSDRISRGAANATNKERMAMLRSEFLQQALPTIPLIPGWHNCWLSATNQYDTIARRARLGYVPITAEDVPNFETAAMKTGEYAGMIAVNEMLAYKIPQDLYEDMMQLFHHELPNEQEDSLRANLELMQGGSLSKGKTLVTEMGDGTAELLKRQSARAPKDWD